MVSPWVDERHDVLIGSGPDTTVWLATERPGPSPAPVGERPPVVVKVVRGGPRAQALRLAARHLADVHHPGLLPVLALWEDPDAGTEPGVVAVLPYVAGGTVRTLLDQRGALAVGEVAALVAPVAGALDRLAEAGVVHGDLTPGNVLLWPDGRPVVADVAGSPRFATPGYAAPEVLDGHPDRRSDVFALGVLAYEALTARRPHRGDPVEALAAAAGGAHRPLASWATIPAAVAEVVERALAPDPAHRHPTAGGFAADLLAVVDPHAVLLPGACAPGPRPVASGWHTVELSARPSTGAGAATPDRWARVRARLRPWPTRRRS
jgi:serine/threonine protein kinase